MAEATKKYVIPEKKGGIPEYKILPVVPEKKIGMPAPQKDKIGLPKPVRPGKKSFAWIAEQVAKMVKSTGVMVFYVTPMYKEQRDGSTMLLWNLYVKLDGIYYKIPSNLATLMDKYIASGDVKKVANVFRGKWKPNTKGVYMAFMRAYFKPRGIPVGMYLSKKKQMSWQ